MSQHLHHDDLERMVRTVMDDCSRDLVLPAGIARQALRRARAAQRVRATGTLAAVGILGAAATSVVAHDLAGRRSASVTPATSPAPTRRPLPCHPDAVVQDTGDVPAGMAAHPSPQLLAVCLPDPAPGFPVRTGRDVVRPGPTGLPRGSGWELLIRVGGPARDASTISPAPACGDSCATASPVPGVRTDTLPALGHLTAVAAVSITEYTASTPPDDDGISGHAVVTSRRVHGYRADLSEQNGNVKIRILTGRFLVYIEGKSGTTLDELITLGDSLQNLS